MSSLSSVLAAFGTVFGAWVAAALVFFAMAFWAEICAERRKLALVMCAQLTWDSPLTQFLKRVGIDLLVIFIGIPIGAAFVFLVVIGVLLAAIGFGLVALFSSGFRMWFKDEVWLPSRNRITHIVGH